MYNIYIMYTHLRKVIGTRRNLERDVVRNDKSRSQPLVLPATCNTGKTGLCRETTGIALVPVQKIENVWLNETDGLIVCVFFSSIY